MSYLEKDPSLRYPRLKTFDYGLWRVMYEDSARKSKGLVNSALARVRQIRDTPVIRFCRDVYSVDPANSILCVISRFLSGVEQSLLVYWSTKIFGLIEAGYSRGKIDRHAILAVLLARVGLSLFTVFWRRWTTHVDAVMETQVRMHYQEQLLKAHCADLQENYDAANDQQFTSVAPPPAWRLIFGILELAQSFLSLFSQLFLLFTLSRSRADGKAMIVVCLAKPLYNLFLTESMFSTPYFAYIHDQVYERMSSMWKIAMDPYYAKEIAACGLFDFLTTEFRQARSMLRGVAERAPYTLSVNDSVLNELTTELLGPLPLIYVATNALIHPHSMSLSSILVINETSFALGNLFSSLSLGLSQLGHDVSDIAALYSRIDAYEAQQATQQQLLPYPLPGSHVLSGMDIKFSNVSFRYPGAPQGQFALRNVSFTIERSSTVVIVGQNGSGKSSLANLLTGLTKPVSGDILIDGIRSSSFRRADLAQAIASLTQDHRILPLSIAENISLGDPSHTQCMGRIREAAELGGAAGFIDKFPDGLDHSLAVLRTHYTHGDLPEGPLADFADEFTRYTDISGGERQRLSAARTFMRLLSPKTKLVVADEPSAAIDPIGEHELFERLREHRRGKTMVFISHRFGHLTKYADQILCMKDGQLVEAGTHAQLMALEGEYRRLYDAQARAFTEDVPPSPDCQ